jgi:hypothetical protein
MNALRASSRSTVGLLCIGLLAAACSAGSAAPSTPPTSAPSAPAASAPADGTVTSPPGGIGQDPGAGGPDGGFVQPKPGQLDVHPVAIDSFAARVDGTTIVVTASWTSGVEPCNTLDHIQVEPHAGTYAVTLFEGHGPQEIACIMIAQQKKTEFEIPVGASGSYTLFDGQGRAAPLEVTIG